MKPLFWRIGAVAASATLAFSLFGCSAGNNQQSNEGDDTVSGKVSDNSGAAEEQTQEPQEVNVGETFTIPDMFEVTLQSAEWLDEVSFSDDFSSITPGTFKEGATYFVIRGTAKNIGAETESVGEGGTHHLSASYLINDKYEIDADIVVDETSEDYVGYSHEIDPLMTGNIIIYGSVSNEIKDAFEGCELTLTSRVPDEGNVWHIDEFTGQYVANFQ